MTERIPITATPAPLPPAMARLSQETRDAIGRAVAQEIVATLDRLVMEARARANGKGGEAYDLGLRTQTKSAGD